MSFDTALPAMIGGFISSTLTEYIGIKNPLIGVLGAGIGSTLLNKFNHYYVENKETLPGADRIASFVDKLQSNIGLKFYNIVIDRGDDIIYNKFEKYILDKYSNSLVSSCISNTDSMNLSLSLDYCEFSKPIIDHFKGHRIVLVYRSNEIMLKSKSLDIEGLKQYIVSIISLRMGIKNIYIHQSSIENHYDKNNNYSGTRVKWTSFTIKTNKNFTNTIVSKTVQKELVEDIATFVNNEDYYNNKGLPYKRGYLLHGPPGTGKTSIIKAIASHYGMDIYIINLGDIVEEKDMTAIFQGTRNNSSYHVLCFEDIDRCEFLTNSYKGSKHENLLRCFLNELDGVIETSKRISILTVNNLSVIENIPALCRPGRIDKKVELTYCDFDQINRLYNHFTDTGKTLNLKQNPTENLTPSQIVKYILANTSISPEDFEKQLNFVSKIEVKEDSIIKSCTPTIQNNKKYKDVFVEKIKRSIRRRKFNIRSYQRKLSSFPKKLKKETEMLKKEQDKLNNKLKSISFKKRKK